MIASVLGATSAGGFSTRSATAITSPSRSLRSAGATQPYLLISDARHVDEGEHDPAVLGVGVQHRPDHAVAVVDEVVGQEDGQRSARGELLAVRDGVAEPARLHLLDVVDAGQARTRAARSSAR